MAKTLNDAVGVGALLQIADRASNKAFFPTVESVERPRRTFAHDGAVLPFLRHSPAAISRRAARSRVRLPPSPLRAHARIPIRTYRETPCPPARCGRARLGQSTISADSRLPRTRHPAARRTPSNALSTKTALRVLLGLGRTAAVCWMIGNDQARRAMQKGPLVDY